MTYRVLMSVFVAVMLLSGCKTEEDVSDNGFGQPAVRTPAPDMTINGRVSLGVAEGASVQIYPVSAGVVDRGNAIGTTKTDALGRFSFVIPRKYSREPALLEVSLADAQVRCIVVAGCGADSAFGDALLEGHGGAQLRLLVPSLSEVMNYQVSLLSEIASAAALAELAGITAASINGAGNIEVQFVVAKANTRVASRFGLVADLPGASIFDITSVDELLAARPQRLSSTILESALLAECVALSPEANYVSGVEFCAAQYNNRGIPGRSSNEAEVSMLRVLASVIEIFEHLQLLGRDFTVEKSEILSQRGVILSQEPGQYSKGVASDNVNLPLIDKGREFVENVRQIASSLDLTKIVALSDLSGFVSGDAAIALEDFGVNVDASELVSGDKPSRALKALGAVTLHAADRIGAYFGVNTGFDSKNLVAQHEVVDGAHHLYFDQLVDVCDADSVDGQLCEVYVNMQVVVGLKSLGGNAKVNLLNLERLTFKFNGTISQDGYELSLESDSASSIAFLELHQGSGEEEGLTLIELVDAKLALPVKAWSSEGNLSHLFKGIIAFEVSHLLATWERGGEQYISEGVLHKTDSIMANIYSLAALNSNMSGRITTETGDDFYAAMNILQSGEAFDGLLEYKSVSSKQCTLQGECKDAGSESTVIGESDDNYVGLTASVSYKADLQGVREPVQLQLSGSRTSPTATSINNLKVTYPGHALRLNGQFNNSGGITSMNANNLDGMEMYINSQPGGKRFGAVVGPGGDKVGDVIDMGEWIKIRYTDGRFVSL